MADDTRTLADTRKEVIGGSVTLAEKALVVAAGAKLGYRNISEYVRSTMLERSHKALGTDRRKAS